MCDDSPWRLNPDVVFFNHGSFGACPDVVLAAQRRWQDQLERDPIQFLAQERELESKLDHVRTCLASLVGVRFDDLVFVRTATDGVNAVLRSFPFRSGDEVVVTDHGYNACNNAVRFAAERFGATVRVARIPFPIRDPGDVVEAVESELNERTRLLLIDHITSPTGLVLPIVDLIRAAHDRDVRVMVDGAHAPGMVPLDVEASGVDYYTANHHKWLCGPKVSAFLYVRPEHQPEVRPTVISHGANRSRPRRSRFFAEFDWCGTFDPTPLLAVPTAIDFLGGCVDGGINALMNRNRLLALQSRDRLCHSLGIKNTAPDEMIGSLVSVPLPIEATEEAVERFQRRLFEEHHIEVPLFLGPGDGRPLMRLSLQHYNTIDQVDRLCRAVEGPLAELGHKLD